MNTRRHAFALAGVLTATALTGAIAVAGLTHHPSSSTPPATPVVQLASQQAPQAPTWADD